MKKLFTALSIVFLIVIDQILKILSVKFLKPVSSVSLIKDFLRFNYVENTGAAFGIFKNNTIVLAVFTFVIIVFCLYFIFIKPFDKSIFNILLAMIVSGGIGNLIDRVFRRYVIDYIEVLFIDFPVFNFADILVTVGCFLLAFYLIFDTYKDKQAEKNKDVKNE